MSTSVILSGLALAAAGFTGRYLLRNKQQILKVASKKLPIEEFSSMFSKYHFGGFETKMSRREAALILGVSYNSTALKIKTAHKKIMIANHPDRGGSPYLAAKINEAKDLLDK